MHTLLKHILCSHVSKLVEFHFFPSSSFHHCPAILFIITLLSVLVFHSVSQPCVSSNSLAYRPLSWEKAIFILSFKQSELVSECDKNKIKKVQSGGTFFYSEKKRTSSESNVGYGMVHCYCHCHCSRFALQ